MSVKPSIKTISIVGFGAFGQLVARHLSPHFDLVVCDPAINVKTLLPANTRIGEFAEAAGCDLVILAMPIDEMASAIKDLRPHLKPGTVILDVVSVKVKPIEIMRELLPPFVEIVGTHPLFGPQSTMDGLKGRKIAVCPVRGKRSALHIAAFLRHALGLTVYLTTPEDHDREAAMVQGITHLIAKALVRMEPLPKRLTTVSFEQLMGATDMVRDDAASVFLAIERDNPFSSDMRHRFFAITEELRRELEAY